MTIHHLVVQSPGLTVEHAEQLAALAQAQGVARISATAARLLDVQHDDATRADVVAWAERHGIDTAFVPAGLKLSHCKVLAMDMDSTLINIECIDEIAGVAGVKDKVSEITEAAMRGEIKDFAESLRRRVALLKDVPAEALEQVYTEKLRLNPGAERLITTAQAAGIKVLLVSGGFTFFTDRLRERLKLDSAHANTLEIDNGVLTGRVLGDILDADAKAVYLREFARTHGATKEQVIAMGDGANDLKMLGAAGFPVAYHAKPLVRQQTRYALNVSGLDGVLNWFES
ncbi:phosphoserine phosphatase SerB [Achromobacter xylosoxidans]|jgi:phosphoserine phosphatase|uniref:Phosphoserine phosphatase n=1 Tax=Alcaligenes xylosoxydans xylosoxydans TaxID=85698 RepID=A0A0D6GJB1_ALCXX|nr:MULTISPECIES: phosphoserine phosphatase SerB [Achromobacter]AHC45857.1 Phosphoserine phosphatase [Achromobacter xylosoxidans NBRC 15126 = ATCC 27061]AMH06256.1 phosphoserine phosphatase SerB [Achromobacter xylosoxidans]AXA76146.1 phosphoserine phosphatase SerB [Achromobacter xylosoxidans]KMJ90072.1 phosphoserine phosphatase [Achromobacter xylosoxidans]KOQ27534.1 phosphoserine phosphatase [Achromobacter xylosoxidans]